MRLLLDECLPTRLAALLQAAGHDCVHVYDLRLGGHPDESVMAAAARDARILISADTDFGELLANSSVIAPSVILIRRADKRPDALCTVLTANLGPIADELNDGAIVVITDTRIRTRRLPLKPAPASRPSGSAEPGSPTVTEQGS